MGSNIKVFTSGINKPRQTKETSALTPILSRPVPETGGRDLKAKHGYHRQSRLSLNKCITLTRWVLCHTKLGVLHLRTLKKQISKTEGNKPVLNTK